MENFPIEIIEKILMGPELSMKDIVNLSLTCRNFYEIIGDNNTIWRRKFFQKWPHLKSKLHNDKIFYHQELRHIFELKKHTRALLATMPEKFYKKVELSESDLVEWEEIIRGKWENIHYLTIDLMAIIHRNKQIDSIDVVPLDTPGNLTQKFYATKVLRYVRQIYLAKTWRKFIALPPERQILEIGAVIVAQWCQPKLEIDPEEIYKSLDGIAEKVKAVLKRDHPDHPLFKASKQQFALWRVEIRPDNEWCPSDCREILAAMREVLFHHMGFMGYTTQFNAAVEDDIYINVVLQTRKGMAMPLAIIFDAVGRRLGLRCEPVVFPSHFLLRFCETQHPNSDWYYIDVFNGGQIVRRGVCPHSNTVAAKRTKHSMSTAEEVIINLANDLRLLARQSYSPSGQVATFRSTLELIQLVNPKDISALINLARLYMVHNFNTSPLENFLLTHHFDVPEQAESLVQMLRNYHADPPDGPIEPVTRPPEVKFAVGMVMYHWLFRYKCVIFNWDSLCLAAADWQSRNNIGNLRLKGNQPFYNVLVEDGSHRYVAQENLKPIFEHHHLQLNDEVGRHFSHYFETHYVPNAQTEYHYPQDKMVRRQYHEEYHEEFIRPTSRNMFYEIRKN